MFQKVQIIVGDRRQLRRRLAGDGFYAWIAGEAGSVVGLRRLLVRELGAAKSQVTFQGYWRTGGSLAC